MYFDLPFSTMNSIYDQEYAIATYYVFGASKNEIIKKSGNFAIGQSVGTWIPLPGMTRDMIENWQARVLGIYVIDNCEEYTSVIKVAFPIENFSGNFAMMITALLGNDVSTAMRVKLVDLEFTKQGLKNYRGPMHGVNGFRSLTNVYDRPLVLNMIKPCIGFSALQGAKFFYESGLGGVDLIKDDEVLANTSVSTVVERVQEYGKAASMVKEEKGKEPVYIVNITDSVKNMRRHAQNIIDEGAKAAMINFMTTGLDALDEMTEEFGERLCFLAHYAGVGIVNGPFQGISDSVALGVLPRLAGADSVMTMYAQESDASAWYDCMQTIQKQKLKMDEIEPIMPSIGGGITPKSIPEIIHTFGNDVIIGVGGAIQGHPMGTTQGAKAVMDTLFGTLEGKTLQEIAKKNKAVKTAIELWG